MSSQTDEHRASKIFGIVFITLYEILAAFIIAGGFGFYGYLLYIRFCTNTHFTGCSCDDCVERRTEYDEQLSEISQTNTPKHLTYNIEP